MNGITLRQLWRFGAIGLCSTAAYALGYWLLHPLVPATVDNALMLLATAITNTAANRRFTFGVRGSSGAAGDHVAGLVAFGLALAVTNLSIAALQAVRPHASAATELAVLVAANTLATLARFLLLRTVIAGRRLGCHPLRLAATPEKAPR
jgi:putative flippase GtrA